MDSDDGGGALDDSVEDRREGGVWAIDGVLLGMSARSWLRE